MSNVYPLCEVCKCRREKCVDQSAHKNDVAWRADVHLTEIHRRLRKTFGSKMDKPKTSAEKQARRWITEYEEGRLQGKKPLEHRPFEQVAQEWWDNMVVVQGRVKGPERSEKSRFEMFVRLFGRRPIASITLQDAQEWLKDRRLAGRTINTINRDMRPLKWILDYAVAQGYIAKNPIDGMKDIKGGNIHDRWMSEEEIELLIKAARDLEDYDLVDFIVIGLNTGFRRGDLQKLTAKDVVGNRVWARMPKSGEPYSVTIPPGDAENTFRRLIAANPTGCLIKKHHLNQRFIAAAKLAGLYTDKNDNNRVTIHTLRHTFGSLYLNRGGDIYKLSLMLDHASVSITERIYARICPKVMDSEAPLLGTRLKQPEFKVA